MRPNDRTDRSAPLLEVERLSVAFSGEQGALRALEEVSFQLRRGRVLGIVGESGCGKSVTALSILRLLPHPAGRILSGAIRLAGEDLLRLSPEEMRRVRGRRIAMIFQEPMTALNPVRTIGAQLAEVYALHFPAMASAEVAGACREQLARVGIPAPEARLAEYPHQISGGMRQRVMIAMALACRPEILIADEPTTALDVTIQAQILDLIQALQAESGMAVVFITHAMGVIARICHDVAVMYAGQVVEQAAVQALFDAPRHPYTRGLLAAIPRLTSPRKQPLSTIAGVLPDPARPLPGCRFANRCPSRMAICRRSPPPFFETGAAHPVRCFLFAPPGGMEHGPAVA
jgi:oligopeptide/dipeptide ABC transporter ATP-binding protein